MKRPHETKVAEFTIVSDDGETFLVYEFKAETHPNADAFEQSRASKSPHYETESGEQVVRLSETTFRVLCDNRIDKIYRLY